MLRDVGESMLGSVRHWAQPRERELRKLRRARRRTIRYGAATGVTVAGAAGLVAVAAPVWAVVVTGGGAAVFVVPAAVALRKYKRLKDRPLPSPTRELPPMSSVARAPMMRLTRAERSLHQVIAVIARNLPVPPDELAEAAATAESAAAALTALSADVVSLERAARSARDGVADDLDNSVTVVAERLEAGVREYEQLLGAAARMTTPVASLPTPRSLAADAELRHAADRLDGWAEALTELVAAPVPAVRSRRRGRSGSTVLTTQGEP